MTFAEVFALDAWIRGIWGGAHFLAALTALLLGPYILAARKGDRRHRWLGRGWLVLMLAVDLSALSMYDLHGRPNLFHFFALLSLSAVIPGFLSIRRYRRTGAAADLAGHQISMHWAYFGLAAAGVWQVATRALTVLGAGSFGGILAVLGVLTFAVSLWFSRFLNRRFAAAVPVP
jgi:uncharacterized membrane protein